MESLHPKWEVGPMVLLITMAPIVYDQFQSGSKDQLNNPESVHTPKLQLNAHNVSPEVNAALTLRKAVSLLASHLQ